MTVVYIAPTVDEANRFSYDDWNFTVLPYNSAVSFFANIQRIFQSQIFIINGYRLPDRYLLNLLVELGKEIYVIQHGTNSNFLIQKASIFETMMKIRPSLIRYINWLSVVVITIFFRLIYRAIFCMKSKKKSIINIYYISEVYKEDWCNFLDAKNVITNYVHCKSPSPLEWGASNEIKQEGRAKLLLIDEPFDNIPGLSYKLVSDEIRSFAKQKNIKKVLVKIHPRTPMINVYNYPPFETISFVPEYLDFLIAYRSNLIRAFDDNTVNNFMCIQTNADGQIFLKKKSLEFTQETEGLFDYHNLFKKIRFKNV